MNTTRLCPCIFLLLILCISTLYAQSYTYTTNADFDQGALVGLEHETIPDQLQLSKKSTTLPFIWVPNTNEGTVSKVDTRTGDELGRYLTGPSGDRSPSRTTVDIHGNCWLGNRTTGTVVKIGLYESGQYIDRNGNGTIETSKDLDGDGNITGVEMLPWGEDECVLYEVIVIRGKEGTYTPGEYDGGYANDSWNPGPRGIAIDSDNNLWAGCYGSGMYYYIDGESGKILRTVDVSSVSHTPYGAVIDGNGILWSSGQSTNHVLRLNPQDDTFEAIDLGHFVYGLGLDQNNHLFISGWDHSKLSRLNVTTSQIEWTVQGDYQSRGVAVTDDGDVWVANSGPGTVTRWSNDGDVKEKFSVGNTPTGVAVDAEGKVWVVNSGDEYIKRIDPSENTIDLSKRIIGGNHYGYSDMTGIVARTITTKTGTWTVVYDSGLENTAWGQISWNASTPDSTSISVKARSSSDQQNWSDWEYAVNNKPLQKIPSARYLQIETTLQIFAGDISPVLYDLTVRSLDAIDCDYFYPNPFNPENETGYFKLCKTTPGEIKIYDASTMLLRTLKIPGNTNRIPWDGREKNNEIIANGVYFFLIEQEGERVSGKIGAIR